MIKIKKDYSSVTVNKMKDPSEKELTLIINIIRMVEGLRSSEHAKNKFQEEINKTKKGKRRTKKECISISTKNDLFDDTEIEETEKEYVIKLY